jgi:hypothetical protein
VSFPAILRRMQRLIVPERVLGGVELEGVGR